MIFRNHHNIILGIHNIIINMHKTDKVQMPRKINAHMLFKKSAKVLSAQTKMVCQIPKCNIFFIMCLNIGYNVIKPFPDPKIPHIGIFQKGPCKMIDKQKQNLHDNRFTAHLIANRLGNIQSG